MDWLRRRGLRDAAGYGMWQSAGTGLGLLDEEHTGCAGRQTPTAPQLTWHTPTLSGETSGVTGLSSNELHSEQ